MVRTRWRTMATNRARARLVALVAAVAATVAVAAAPVRAEDDLTSMSLEDLLQVRITGASKYEQPLADAPAAVTVITRDEIRAYGWRTIEQALSSLPGVHVTFDRQYTYAGIRGLGLLADYDTRLLVTVNGARINEPMFDSGPMGRQLPIDLALIDRIEFFPGPGGAIYGQNAMVGVVNLVTREGRHYDGGEVAVGYSHPQRLVEARATWGRRLENGIDVLMSVTAMRARGQDLAFDYGAAGVSGVARGLDGETDADAYLRLARGPWTVEILGGRWRKEDATGAYFADPLVPGQYQGEGYLHVHAQHRSRPLAGVELLARAFAGWHEYRSRLSYGNFVDYPTKASWAGGELRLLADPVAGHRLLLGIEGQDNRRISQFIIDSIDASYDRRIDTPGHRIGAYLQDEWHIAPDLIATLGARVDHDDRAGTQTSPRVALVWHPTPATSIKALHGRAHRSPNAYERSYEEEGYLRSNRDLCAETFDTMELIAEHRAPDDLSLRASAYRWSIRNAIVLGPDPVSGASQYRNGSPAGGRGVEFGVDKTWRSGARLRASLAWQRAIGEADVELPNSPRRIGWLGFVAPIPGFPATFAWETQAESARTTLAGDRLGGRAVSSANVVVRDTFPGLEWSLAVHNVFDKRYAHPAAAENWQTVFEQDGRGFRLEARYRF